MWAYHERLEDYITEETCRVEIESCAKHGQLIPVLGRPLRNDPSYEVELIFGARRLFVARHLNIPLVVELREMTDKEAVIAMEIENHHRAATSPYERGLTFARWLRENLFESQDDIARALNISKSQVSRYLRVTKLPSVILGAFESPCQICESWGLDLMNLWEDPQRQRALARRARTIRGDTNRPSARDVYRMLVDSSITPRRRASKLVYDEIVRAPGGAPLFHIRHHHDSIAILLPLRLISKKSLQHIKSVLAEVLQHTTEQHVEVDAKTQGICLPENELSANQPCHQ